MTDDLPSAARDIAETYPDVWQAYGELGARCAEAGPLDGRTVHLVKLALAIGAQSAGATHSHTRRALKDGLRPEELYHVALLAIGTLGFPQAVRGFTWIGDYARPAAEPRPPR